jgi:hemolysin activation/secretion protein
MRALKFRLWLIANIGLAVTGMNRAQAQARPEPAAIERTISIDVPRAQTAPTIFTPAADIRSHSIGTGRFTLGAVNIDGATAFSRNELSHYFEPYLATDVDDSKLSELAARITQHYRETGYVLSYAVVPPQNVEAGMVRIAVVEGRIGNVTFNGAGAEKGALEAIAAPLLQNAPLKTSTLERVLGLMRDFPGLKVTDVALLRTDAEAGLYALNITIKRERYHALAYADNRGTQSVGRMRFYSSASMSSLALEGDELRVDLFGMPGRKFHYLYGQVLAGVPLGYSGARLTISASKGDQYLKDERFNGNSTNFSAQLSYPMLRSRKLTLVGKLSVNDLRSLGEDDETRKLRDRLRVARLGIEFANEAKARLQGEFTLSRGLGFGPVTEVGDPLASRTDASGKFTKAALTFQVSRPLGDRVSIRGVAAAQYSNRPVLSAEEFSLGGNRIGRAFAFNALTGDRGVGGGAEISYRLPSAKKGAAGVELFGFVDGGSAFEANSAEVTRHRRRSLASVGAGSRFSVAGASLSVEVSVPVAAKGLDRSAHLFFSTYRAF